MNTRTVLKRRKKGRFIPLYRLFYYHSVIAQFCNQLMSSRAFAGIPRQFAKAARVQGFFFCFCFIVGCVLLK